VAVSQHEIDRRNADFWDELCASQFAKALGITDSSPESIARFDRAYFDYYPYLLGYLPDDFESSRVLEIGLGFGSLSQAIAERGADYNGLDIAGGPVEMVRERLRRLGIDDAQRRIQQGSVLEIPHQSGSFDQVITIGCLHHTGDIAAAVAEVHRVLRAGGRTVAMLYNRRSYRRVKMALADRLHGRAQTEEDVRGLYDTNLKGEAPPTTEYTTRREAKRLFSRFAELRIRAENFEHLVVRGKTVSRDRLLGWPARVAGLDLYITAVK
jgi:SAM-dependent methyltransferase